jgi:hypothetical protein
VCSPVYKVPGKAELLAAMRGQVLSETQRIGNYAKH